MLVVEEEPIIESFDAIQGCRVVNQAIGETNSLLLAYPKENAMTGSLTFEFEVYSDKRLILVEDLMNKEQPKFPYVATRLLPYDKVEEGKHWVIQARNTTERTQRWTMTVDNEQVRMKKNSALKFSVVDSANREVGLERKINLKWTKEYPIDKFEWRLLTFIPFFLGLMLINFVSQNSNSKLLEHFKLYPIIGFDTYYSYLISFLVGFLACYLMVYLADYYNTNGEGTFSLFPRKQMDARPKSV